MDFSQPPRFPSGTQPQGTTPPARACGRPLAPTSPRLSRATCCKRATWIFLRASRAKPSTASSTRWAPWSRVRDSSPAKRPSRMCARKAVSRRRPFWPPTSRPRPSMRRSPTGCSAMPTRRTTSSRSPKRIPVVPWCRLLWQWPSATAEAARISCERSRWGMTSAAAFCWRSARISSAPHIEAPRAELDDGGRGGRRVSRTPR